MKSKRALCLSTGERRTSALTDMDWFNSELYALLAIKTSDTVLSSIKSLEEAEVKGIIGWQRMEREAPGYHRHRVALLTESVTHPERVLKVTDLLQAFYRWETSLREFQRGRWTELDDDVKANAMRHMMPKDILDAADLQPQYRTFSENRGLHVATGATAIRCTRGRCVPSKRENWYCHVTCEHEHEYSHLNTNTPTIAKVATLVPMDVSQMSSNALKNETVEQESDSYHLRARSGV